MKINNKLRKRLIALALLGTVSTTFSGCNKQMIDLNKSFNVAIETNQDNVSVVGIS